MIQHAIDKATLFATPVVNFEKVYNPKLNFNLSNMN